LAGLLLAALVFWGTMLFSPKFQSNLDVLVIQNQENFVDSYALAKSTEHFSKLLSESVYTETFLGKVTENYPELARVLPIDREERMKEWGKMVRTSLNVELGMIHIKVLASERAQAENISKTIAGVLANSNNLFVSPNQKIEVRMVNAPVVKSNPGAAAMAVLVVVSFLVGMFLVLAASFYGFILRKDKSQDESASCENVWGRNVTRDSDGNLIDAQTWEIVFE